MAHGPEWNSAIQFGPENATVPPYARAFGVTNRSRIHLKFLRIRVEVHTNGAWRLADSPGYSWANGAGPPRNGRGTSVPLGGGQRTGLVVLVPPQRPWRIGLVYVHAETGVRRYFRILRQPSNTAASNPSEIRAPICFRTSPTGPLQTNGGTLPKASWRPFPAKREKQIIPDQASKQDSSQSLLVVGVLQFLVGHGRRSGSNVHPPLSLS